MCHLVQERNKNGGKTKIVGNDVLHGQIASFMDSLHLSYKEVFEVMPYRNLILMQKDKLHESFGDIVTKASSIELAGNKIKG